jgi:hypothetical protein
LTAAEQRQDRSQYNISIFHNFIVWLELTSLDMASHGPQSSVKPVAWSVTVYATRSYELVLQYAKGKSN